MLIGANRYTGANTKGIKSALELVVVESANRCVHKFDADMISQVRMIGVGQGSLVGRLPALFLKVRCGCRSSEFESTGNQLVMIGFKPQQLTCCSPRKTTY
jgi:hypothetical protein